MWLILKAVLQLLKLQVFIYLYILHSYWWNTEVQLNMELHLFFALHGGSEGGRRGRIRNSTTLPAWNIEISEVHKTEDN